MHDKDLMAIHAESFQSETNRGMNIAIYTYDANMA